MFTVHSLTPPFLNLASDEDLLAAIQRSNDEAVVLFKHSATCPISAGAHSRLTEMTEAADPPIYRLVVQEHRGLSDGIAEQFEVRHESPQVLVLVDGDVIFHTSHSRIKADRLRDAIERAGA